MANTYTLIASNTVGSGGTAAITFSSIPATYTDLLVKMSARTAYNIAGSISAFLRFNGDTGSNYSGRRLIGTGSSVTSDNSSTTSFINTFLDITAYTANTFGNAEYYIPNYTGSTAKSISVDGVTEHNAVLSYASLVAGLWTGTAAITSINIAPEPSTGDFVQYSSFYLYGIKSS
jgi:hypothetical protein